VSGKLHPLRRPQGGAANQADTPQNSKTNNAQQKTTQHSACNFCSADRVAAIQDQASYVDPIARDICSDWANFDCLKWDDFPAVGFLGGLSSFQRWGLLISCPLSCYQENRVETYYLRQVPTCALVEEDSIETFDGDGEKCAGVCKAKKFNGERAKRASLVKVKKSAKLRAKLLYMATSTTELTNSIIFFRSALMRSLKMRLASLDEDNILFKDKLGYSCVDYWMNDGSPGTFDCFDKDYFADNLFSDLEVAQFWDSCPNACRVFC